jgi:acyl-CoA thioester hydrolase
MQMPLIEHAHADEFQPPFKAADWSIPHPAAYLVPMTVGAEHLSPVVPHVSNIEILRWLERAAVSHSDSLGYDRARLEEARVMWFVARHEIDYEAEALLGDQLVIATWVRDVRRVRSWRDSIIVRPADRTIVCRSSTLWVLVDLDTRRPRRIPRQMGLAFSPLIRLATDDPSEG